MPVRAIVAMVAGLSVLAASSPADAGSLEDCAQRVLRDWYTDGRVDTLYPLPCYRAAIGLLPNDVLQYTDAGDEIARALEQARHRRTERTVRRPAAPKQEAEPTRKAAPPPEARAAAGHSSERAAPAPPRARPKARPAAPRIAPEQVDGRGGDGVLRVASRPQPPPGGAGLPYPLIALAALGPILLVSGLVAALARRRR